MANPLEELSKASASHPVERIAGVPPDSREQAKRERKRAYNRAWHAANREKVATYNRAYRRANPEKVRAWERAKRERNKRRIRAYRRAYRKKNREKLRANDRAWYERNRERVLAHMRQQYDTQRQYVSPEELEACRQDPRKAFDIAGEDVIVCLECGQMVQTLSRHLGPEHGMTAAEYRRKPGPDGQIPRYNATTRLISKNLRKRLPHNTETLRHSADWLAKHRPPIEKLTAARRARRMSLESRLNRRERMKGKPRPERWKASQDGRIATDVRIAQLRLQGMRMKDIGQALGLTGGESVRRRLRSMGFPPGRPCLFEHGEPVIGRHILDLRRDFGLTNKDIAGQLFVHYNTVLQRSTGSRVSKPLSVWLAKRVLHVQERLRKQYRHQGATRRGGRPGILLPSERVTIRAKYQLLRRDVEIIRRWLKQQDGKIRVSKVWVWLCERSRDRTIQTLLFWPEFLRSVTTSSGFLDWQTTYLSPQLLAQHFLAESYEVSIEAMRRAIQRQLDRQQVVAAQDPLVSRLLADIRRVFAGQEAMSSVELVLALNGLEESLWMELGLTPRKLARMLKPLGIKRQAHRLGGKVVKGYRRKDMERASRETS